MCDFLDKRGRNSTLLSEKSKVRLDVGLDIVRFEPSMLVGLGRGVVFRLGLLGLVTGAFV